MNFRFHEMPEISRLDEDVLASQEDLCCLGLVSQAVGWLVCGIARSKPDGTR